MITQIKVYSFNERRKVGKNVHGREYIENLFMEQNI